jgi:hypothetical protein
MKFERFEVVRVKGEPKGSINEFARIQGIMGASLYWIANLNMPFSGTISRWAKADELEKVKK